MVDLGIRKVNTTRTSSSDLILPNWCRPSFRRNLILSEILSELMRQNFPHHDRSTNTTECFGVWGTKMPHWVWFPVARNDGVRRRDVQKTDWPFLPEKSRYKRNLLEVDEGYCYPRPSEETKLWWTIIGS